jgi:hypothetical protein
MTGYRDTGGYLPPYKRERPPTRLEWAVAGFAVLMAVVMMTRGIAGDSTPSLLKHFGLWPIALTEFLFAWTLWIRARVNGPEERHSPRSLRLTALFFVLLAAATIAVGLL